MLSGDPETGKTILRDYLKASVARLGETTGAPPRVGYLQKWSGVHLHVAHESNQSVGPRGGMEAWTRDVRRARVSDIAEGCALSANS